MISAQSLLPPLSGSRLFLAAALLMFASCSIFRPEKKQPPVSDKPPVEQDTTIADTPDKPDKPAKDTFQRKEMYEVAVLLPLHLDTAYWQGSGVPSQSVLGLEFYEGMALAFEELKKTGLSMNVHVYDTRNSPSETQDIINRIRLKPLDLIIGPVYNPNLEIAAKHAKRNRIYLVSPLSPSPDVVEENPYFILANATLESHCKNLVEYVARRFSDNNVVIAGYYNEKDHADRFQQNYKKLHTTAAGDSIIQVLYNSTEPDSAKILPHLSKEDTNIVIVPSFNEAFVASMLFQLNSLSKNYPIIVVGMPTWDKYNSLRTDYLHNLNVHISQSFFVDEKAHAVRVFQKKFYNKYKTLPSPFAYEGYDVTKTFGALLQKYGLSFPHLFTKERYKGLHQDFAFDAAYSEEEAIKYYDNRGVHIVKFRDYELVKVK